MNKKTNTRNMTYYGMIMAIIIVMSLVPFLGYIQIPPLAITLIHIPVIIGSILFGWKAGLLFALTFGLSSMFVAMTRGATPLDLLFINPLVSVLPRVIFGALIYPIYRFFERVQSSEALSIGITAFVSTFIHSILVLTAMFLALGLKAGSFDGNVFMQVLAAVLTVVPLLEAVASTLISIPLVKAVRKSFKRN